MDKYFLIAIGGTGMRCLESFVHLCAAGLFDNATIEILTLDTDLNNGNKGRVEDLIASYNKVKTNDENTVGGEQRSNTFFSAKLNLYKFYTDYSEVSRRTYSALTSGTATDAQIIEDNQDLSDLFFDHDTVQQFQLDHGYRAQTHLGSLLMYHGIIEAARNAKEGKDVKPQEKELLQYLHLLNKHASNARVFVFGSVFGGTGASSIPVIPLAISEALKIITGGNNTINLDKILFGSTLLTDYFTFNPPSQTQLQRDKIIADSMNFALNSQAALSFYNGDVTVQKTYKKLYHIGWPAGKKTNYSEQHSGVVTTGGSDQRNDAHVAELLCAMAAYDFFTENRDYLSSIKTSEYVFRSVATDENGELDLSGASFMGEDKGEVFENKLGALLSLAHTILSKFDGAQEEETGTSNLLNYLDETGFQEYSELKDSKCEEIDQYFKQFGYKFVNNEVKFGWIYQIFRSVGSGRFLFSSEAFKTNIDEIRNIDPGAIFLDETHNWDKRGMNIFARDSEKRFNQLIHIFKQPTTLPDESQGDTLKERFLGHMYNAITTAQKFEE